MLSVTTIKRSPIVPLRMFLSIEILGLILFLIATNFDALKLQLYSLLPLSRFFTYETTKFLVLSGAQFLITVYAFLSWYYESFAIRPGLLSHAWGVFFKKEKTLPLEKSMTVTLSSGPLGKLFHYGSINIEGGNSQSSMVLRNISRPGDLLKTIEGCIDPHARIFNGNPDISRVLSGEEHEKLEFKSSLRFDHKMGQVNRELEKSVMKTIAAFLNTKGGYLVLGVSNERESVGLEKDYASLHREDRDGFENHFTQLYNAMIGPELRYLVNLTFQEFQGREICVVQTARSPRPVYLKFDDAEYFYVRTGNVSTPLKLSEVELYSKSRWPRRTASA